MSEPSPIAAVSPELPKATVKLQASPLGATPAVPRPSPAGAPKATVRLAPGPVSAVSAPAPVPVPVKKVPAPVAVGAPVAASVPVGPSPFEAAEEEVAAPASGGLEKWLAIAATVVALLSALSTYMAYSSLK